MAVDGGPGAGLEEEEARAGQHGCGRRRRWLAVAADGRGFRHKAKPLWAGNFHLSRKGPLKRAHQSGQDLVAQAARRAV